MIQLVGHMGGYADLIVELQNDIPRLLQVKTITHYIKHDTYFMTNNSKYPDNMLIAMVDNAKLHFAVEFAGKINVKRLGLAFNYKKSKYEIQFYNDYR